MKLGTFLAAILFWAASLQAQSAHGIHGTVLGEINPKTPEISTDELRRILEEKTVVVFDVRPALEFAISHIPGAVNVSEKPGTSKALYVSDVTEIERVLKNEKAVPLVLYCNGPFCGKSKRVAEELVSAGYSNVRRYQLGIPVWRALGGITQVEPEGVKHIYHNDRTAVWLDTRTESAFRKGTVPGAKRIGAEVTQGGKDNPAMQKAKNDGILPMEDHNTRIIVFGDDQNTVRAVAETIAREAFHNVSFFSGSSAELLNVVK